MKRELKDKWLALQSEGCLIQGSLAVRNQDGNICSCSAGFLLRAAGYCPVFEGSREFPSFWTSPTDDPRVDTLRTANTLLKGTGITYRKLYIENDIPGTTPEHMIDFIKGLPVDPDTTGDVT